MKKNTTFLLLLIMASFSFTFCAGDISSKKKTTKNNNKPDITQNPVYKKGVELVAKNGCYTCHKIDQSMTGPSYQDVANKYSIENKMYLAKKIIEGGKGVWGEIPMIPHPNIPQMEVEQMVDYILLLKK